MTDAQRLAWVRGVHTAIYALMVVAIFTVVYAGVTGAKGPWLWLALALVATEVAVFAGCGLRCPMTAMATRYGAAPGADTFLPERFTRHTATIFGPLIVVGVVLLAGRWALGF